MILVAPGTILAMTPKSDLLGGPTKENARTLLSPSGSNGPIIDSKNHARTFIRCFCFKISDVNICLLFSNQVIFIKVALIFYII